MSEDESFRVDRRRLLGLAGAGLAGLAIPQLAGRPAAARMTSRAPSTRFGSYPFTLGVASGDPLPDGVVLWTRLAPDPVALDGFGGLPQPHQRIPALGGRERRDVRCPQRRAAWRGLRRAGVRPLGPRRGERAPAGPRVLVPLPGRQRDQRRRAQPHGARPGRPVSAMAFAFVSCQSYPAGRARGTSSPSRARSPSPTTSSGRGRATRTTTGTATPRPAPACSTPSTSGERRTW